MDYLLSSFNSIGDIMLSGIVSSAVDREIDSRTSQTQGRNPAHGEIYTIQRYVIKLISDKRYDVGFLLVLQFPPVTKLAVMK
jgi:hypothetical protein